MLRGICLDIAGKKSDLIISSTLFERIVGMEMKERPARVGSFAQNIHEFQSLRDFLSSPHFDDDYRFALHPVTADCYWHYRRRAGMDPGTDITDCPIVAVGHYKNRSTLLWQKP